MHLVIEGKGMVWAMNSPAGTENSINPDFCNFSHPYLLSSPISLMRLLSVSFTITHAHVLLLRLLLLLFLTSFLLLPAFLSFFNSSGFHMDSNAPFIIPLFLSSFILHFSSSQHSLSLQFSTMFSSFCSALSVLFIPNSSSLPLDHIHQLPQWFEEQLEDDLKWSFAVNRVLHATTSEFQDIVLLDTQRFGKALLLDGKLQSAEKDEFIYHESLVHPALLLHHNPKTVFIMGGGEGSTARETLKHKSIEKVVMCDIDRDVVNFCRAHLKENQDAFQDEKLQIIFDDAKAGLEGRPEKFDVIIGDLSDPHEGGPCNHLYTKSFYENVIKPKLSDNGIFVTQAGPAGILSHKVFSSIYNTVKHVFRYVIAYTAHVPSYADSCGWVLASDHPIKLDMEDLNNKIHERVRGELHYLDGAFIVSSTVINKTIRTSMMNETHVFTEEDARFAHGRGLVGNA